MVLRNFAKNRNGTHDLLKLKILAIKRTFKKKKLKICRVRHEFHFMLKSRCYCVKSLLMQLMKIIQKRFLI